MSVHVVAIIFLVHSLRSPWVMGSWFTSTCSKWNKQRTASSAFHLSILLCACFLSNQEPATQTRNLTGQTSEAHITRQRDKEEILFVLAAPGPMERNGQFANGLLVFLCKYLSYAHLPIPLALSVTKSTGIFWWILEVKCMVNFQAIWFYLWKPLVLPC